MTSAQGSGDVNGWSGGHVEAEAARARGTKRTRRVFYDCNSDSDVESESVKHGAAATTDAAPRPGRVLLVGMRMRLLPPSGWRCLPSFQELLDSGDANGWSGGHVEAGAARARGTKRTRRVYSHYNSELDTDAESQSVKRGAAATSALADAAPSPRRVLLVGTRMRLLPPSGRRLPSFQELFAQVRMAQHEWYCPRVASDAAAPCAPTTPPPTPPPPSPCPTEDDNMDREGLVARGGERLLARGGDEPTPAGRNQRESSWTWSDADSTCSELAFDMSAPSDDAASAVGDCVSRSLAFFYADDEASEDSLCGCPD